MPQISATFDKCIHQDCRARVRARLHYHAAEGRGPVYEVKHMHKALLCETLLKFFEPGEKSLHFRPEALTARRPRNAAKALFAYCVEERVTRR